MFRTDSLYEQTHQDKKMRDQDTSCHYQFSGNKMEDVERKIDMHQIRRKAWTLCKNYLTGVWKTVKAEDLIIEEIW